MSENINLSGLNRNQLRDFNFTEHQNLITDQQFEELITREGEVTLDAEGHFKVINPPAKRDNVFVSFIKKIFVKGYAEKERQFNRMELLRQNAHFNAMLKQRVKNYAASQIGETKIIQSAKNINQAIDAHFNENLSLKMENLRELIETTKRSNDSVKQYSTTLLDDNKGSSSVIYKGESFGLNGFLKKFAPQNNFSSVAFLDSIIQKAVDNPEQFDEIGQKNNALKMKTLLAEAKLSGFDHEKINALIANITNTVRSRTNEFIQNSLLEGEDPKAVAQKVLNALDSLTSGALSIDAVFDEEGALGGKNNNQVALADDLQVLSIGPDSDEILKSNTDKLKQAFPRLNSKQLARIISFNSNDPQKVDNYIKVVQDVGNNNTMAPMITELLDNADKMKLSSMVGDAEYLFNCIKNGLVNEELTADKIAECLKIMVNFDMVSDPDGKLANVNYENMTEKLFPAVEALLKEYTDTLNQDIQKAEAKGKVLEDLPQRTLQKNNLQILFNVLKEAKEQIVTGKLGSTVSNIGELLAEKEKLEKLTNLKTILRLKLPTNPPEIKDALKIFPSDLRSGIAVTVKEFVIEHISKYGYTLNQNEPCSLRDIADYYADILRNDQQLMSVISPKNINSAHLRLHENMFINDETIGIKQTYLNGRNLIENNWHKNLDNDVKRNVISKINDTSIENIQNEEQKAQKVHEILEAQIDNRYLGFITTYLMQGGASRYLDGTINNPDLPSLIPGIKFQDIVMNGISISEKPTHQVDIKDGKVVITTQVEPKLVLLQHYQQLDVRTPPALFYTVKYETTIDMSKGVDQDGYPLGLQTKISFVKNK